MDKEVIILKLLKEMTYKNENINIDEYLKMRELVKEKMEHPEWLGDFSQEDLRYELRNGSKIWIFYLENEPICSMMLMPSSVSSLKKFNLNLDPSEVVDYGPMFVNPNYIGNKLQYQMLVELDNYCREKGYKYAVATIHPDNIFSINNIMKNGFKLTGQKEFKRGIRNIYLKNLNTK